MSGAAGPVMLVVGGTGSIGREIAAQAIAAGWRVVVHGRSEASVAEVCLSLGHSERVIGLAQDALVAGGAEAIVERGAASFGRIDALIDCASSGAPGTIGCFAATDPAGYAAMLDRSTAHVQRLAQAGLGWLVASGGTLIAFASDAGRFAAPNQSIVAASRAGIMAFVRNLAVEVARDGVRVHCIAPGFVDGTASMRRTEARSPARVAKAHARAGLGLPTPADIAPLVLFLCGDGARRITGQVVSINGGINA